MRRNVSALLVAVLAALLSLLLAVPANAADAAPGGIPPKPLPTDPRFKYGLDYFYKELFDPNNPQGWKSVNVNESVNPSKTGGSWYLNNVKNSRTLPSGTANKPLTGKIIMPGETIVRPPSVYKPTVPFAAPGAALGLSRLIGAAGFGMGGVVEAPSNWKDIARAKVSAGCNLDTNAGCTSADFGQILSVTNCSHTASCVALGGKDANGNPITSEVDWFKDTALPFLKDLWSMITGQGQSDKADQQVSDGRHYELSDARGCFRSVSDFTQDANGVTGTIKASGTITHPRPTDTTSTAYAYWGIDCGNLSNVGSLRGMWTTVCADIDGKTTNASGASYGRVGRLGDSSSTSDFKTDGTARYGLCQQTVPTKMKAIRFYNDYDQAAVDRTPAAYGILKYSEWITPDTNFDSIDATKVTTTVDCRVPTGETFTYSKSVQKVAAFEAPACPQGSELVRHDVKDSTGATLDAGGEVPGASAKYPTCAAGTSGCALSVEVDGQPCTTTREDCRNWPAVAAQAPSRVVCKWGTNVMPISDCYVISEGYKTDIGVVLDPRSGTWVGLDSTGSPIAPAPTPWNPSNPSPVAGQTPSTGGSTGTTPATGGFPSTGTNPSNNCDAPGWSWNPVEWVHNPVVCALKDAFIPKTDVQARSNELRDKALGTAPLGWAINPPIIGPGAGAGCPNWNIKVEGMSKNVVCESSFTAAVVGVRGPLFGLVASAMMWPLLRSIWYALIPIVRVTPSGSK